MKREFAGDLDASNLHVGVAVASWNQAITGRLLDGALARLDTLNISNVTILRVPGALELPVAARGLSEAGCDAVVAIGVVIKGETDHYDVVVRESSAGIASVAVMTGTPVANAILAVHDAEQAIDRSGTGSSNKGAEAVEAAILTASALSRLAES